VHADDVVGRLAHRRGDHVQAQAALELVHQRSATSATPSVMA